MKIGYFLVVILFPIIICAEQYVGHFFGPQNNYTEHDAMCVYQEFNKIATSERDEVANKCGDEKDSMMFRLSYGNYEFPYTAEIFTLAKTYNMYDFLYLEWWRTTSSKRRIAILLSFYHCLNPKNSNFPDFKSNTLRFYRIEAESRMKELNFVNKVLRKNVK